MAIIFKLLLVFTSFPLNFLISLVMFCFNRSEMKILALFSLCLFFFSLHFSFKIYILLNLDELMAGSPSRRNRNDAVKKPMDAALAHPEDKQVNCNTLLQTKTDECEKVMEGICL